MERKVFNFESVILSEITLEKEGFDPQKIGYQKKHIWAVCRFCGKPHRLLGSNYKTKGSACHKECRLKEQSVAGSPFSNPEVRAKADKTRLDRYGSIYASKNIDIAKKISKVRLSQENQNKIKKTCMEKYGFDNPSKSKDIKDKIKTIFQDKYGVDHPMKDPKRVKIALNRFQDTVEINEEENYNLINILRSDSFWIDLAKTETTLTSISEKYNIKYKSLTSTLVKDEFKDRYYETYRFPKYQSQMDVIKYLVYNGEINHNTRKIINPLELDIYFPEKSFAIEFNGSHWHSEAMLDSKDARQKHIRKTRLCEEKGIRLFHIFEHHWINRKKQILNLIKSALGLNSIRIGARSCEITNDKNSQFIEDNHIQGSKINVIRYFNLDYKGKTVASMTASAHHRLQEDTGIVVLSRLCFLDDVTVSGGSSRLFSKFIDWARLSGFSKIVSWSDNCYTQGSIYRTLDFSLSNESYPDYFYWDSHDKCYRSKQSQKKIATNCPGHMNEREWAVQRGLYRIWDCGKKKWEYKL